MALDIVIYGDAVLRQKAKPIKKVDKEVRRLLDDMVEAMEAAQGIGLAAPQIGVPVRAWVCRVDKDLYQLVNPRIVTRSPEEEVDIEGCLSLPGLRAEVKRPLQVRLSGLDEIGKKVTVEAEGLLARCFCHESDHLDGRLFVDIMEPDTLHWLVRVEPEPEEEEVRYERQPTTLDEAFDFFLKRRLRRHGPQEM